MSDNGWYILLFILALVLLGMKLVVWLLLIGVLVWLVRNRP